MTAGQSGEMPDSHRQARDWLAAKAGLPPLGAVWALAAGRSRRWNSDGRLETRVLDALTTIAEYYHLRLKENPQALEWLKSKYAITDETIDGLRIGYAENQAWKGSDGKEHPGAVQALRGKGFSFAVSWPRPARSSRPSRMGVFPFYNGRLIFPYWSAGGGVAFLIGRQTPWTPGEPLRAGQIQKTARPQTPTSGGTSRHASTTGTLYNEDCLLPRPGAGRSSPKGVTDCIALMQAGFPVVSPVTVQIRADDWDRIIPKLRGAQTVYICQGQRTSRRPGSRGRCGRRIVLSEQGIETRIVMLPLGEAQEAARRRLKDDFGLEASVGPAKLRELLKARSSQAIVEAETTDGRAKIDVNDYFASGKTGGGFRGAAGRGACAAGDRHRRGPYRSA